MLERPDFQMDAIAVNRRRGIVISVDSRRNVFAVQAGDGRCAVFRQLAGPLVLAGDMLEGTPLGPEGLTGTEESGTLAHAEGVCQVVNIGWPPTRDAALVQVEGEGGAAFPLGVVEAGASRSGPSLPSQV